ncbi:hypothetical protein HVE01_22660 [Vreelandella venusta]|nr:hypothetical protein HVE01_22660 [Halomonas venusta]
MGGADSRISTDFAIGTGGVTFKSGGLAQTISLAVSKHKNRRPKQPKKRAAKWLPVLLIDALLN